MSETKHTPGPWRWEYNQEHRGLDLVGGKPKYDLTVMDFERWGMNGATARFRDTAHDGLQLLYRVHERPDWVAPEPGREHHKNWHQLLTPPDAVLIADIDSEHGTGYDLAFARAAISKATGAQP